MVNYLFGRWPIRLYARESSTPGGPGSMGLTPSDPPAAKPALDPGLAATAVTGALTGATDPSRKKTPDDKGDLATDVLENEIDVPKGKRGGGGRGGSTPAPTAGQLYDPNTKLNIKATDPKQLLKQRQALSAELAAQQDPAQIDRVEKYDKTELVNNLDQQINAARQQYNTQVDNAMGTQARDLNRALADAQSQFQTQQNQVTANEMASLDNAALYAEARGDKGGIGQAQYNSVQNNAAQNRLAVSQAQTKMATDTARQISDLRAQGEFERADKMLALTQQYLSELRQIEEYAANYNLSVDQINTAIQEWEYNYEQAAEQFRVNTELSLAQLTGMFSNGMSTYDARQQTQQAAAQLALSLIEAGVKPNQLSASQLNALADVYGMNQSAVNWYFKRTN